jgi:hypothetical protein
VFVSYVCVHSLEEKIITFFLQRREYVEASIEREAHACACARAHTHTGSFLKYVEASIEREEHTHMCKYKVRFRSIYEEHLESIITPLLSSVM